MATSGPTVTLRISSRAELIESVRRTEQRETIGRQHQLPLEPSLEHQAVEGRRRDQQRVGRGPKDQRTDVDSAFEFGERGKPRGEGDGQQEREQQLHAGLRDPNFLQYLGIVSVQPLGGRLPASHEVPLVMRVRLLKQHRSIHGRALLDPVHLHALTVRATAG
jgi:hypothetical protein